MAIFQSSKCKVNEETHHGEREGFVITQSISFFFFISFLLWTSDRVASALSRKLAQVVYLSRRRKFFDREEEGLVFVSTRLTPESPSSV